MKKITLSLFVILVFGAYVVRQKLSANDDVNVIPPKNTQNTLQDTITPTPSSNSNNLAPTQAPSQSPTNAPVIGFKDGSYTGDTVDNFYGTVQVKVSISGGKLTDVAFLQYPSDRQTSIQINNQAMPYLKSEAIAAQSAHVDIISGATQTSESFISSLGSALAQAK